MGGIAERLRARDARRRSDDGAAPLGRAASESAPVEESWDSLPAGVVPAEGPEGEVLLRQIDYPADDAGRRALALDPSPLELLARDRRLARFTPAEAVFLDTETTSLSGGAGVLVFLVALGRLGADGSFTIRQFFLGSPGRERAMLAAVAAELARARAAVTFFGKSFDRHRLEDKFAIHGLPSRFPAEEHVDLYHISRARFGWKLADGRLRTVERSILGIERVGDLPGSQAPKAYFDWLGKRPGQLARVFDHNRDDVRSLVSLLSACAAPLAGARAGERLAAARAASALSDWARAREEAEAARSDPADRWHWEPATRILAEALRRSGGAAAARPALEELASGGCAESTWRLARIAWESARDADAARRLLALASERSVSMPAGKGRDELRAAIVRLRGRIYSGSKGP
jgi:uncharacterized protein